MKNVFSCIGHANSMISFVITNRDLVSVGAVGAAAPTDFEESSFCTLDFHTAIDFERI